jgi:hypothetical protein
MNSEFNINGQLLAFSDSNSGAWFKIKVDLSDPLIKEKFEAIKLIIGEPVEVGIKCE